MLKKLLAPSPFKVSLLAVSAVLALMKFEDVIRLPLLIEYKILDYRFKLRGEEKPENPATTILAIDEKTLNELGRWPFSRSRIADLIDALREYGAKVIVFDIVFAEEDKNSELMKMRELKSLYAGMGLDSTAPVASLLSQVQADPQLAAKVGAEAAQLQELANKQLQFANFIGLSERKADSDLFLSEAIQRTPNVVLGYFFGSNYDDVKHLTDEDIAKRTELIQPSRISSILDRRPDPEAIPLRNNLQIYTPVPNIPVLAKSTENSAHFVQIPDEDGAIRWYPNVVRFQDSYYPALALKAAALYVGESPVMNIDEMGHIESILVGEHRIDTDEFGRSLINFRGPGFTFPHVSFVDVIKRTADASLIKDKIILIGPTAVGIYDLRVTPFDPVMAGVEIHANMINNILTDGALIKPRWMRGFDLLSVIVIGLLFGILMTPLPSFATGIIALGTIVGYGYFAQWVLWDKHIWLTMVYPFTATVVVYGSILVFKYFTEERNKKKVKNAFQYYLNPEVVDQVLKDPSKLKLGGERRILSVMFSDIRGFTTISEKLDAEELSHLLNEYLTPMTDVVFKYNGTLDKYIGDAIMAIYGAPVHYPDHARRACHAALDMVATLAPLREEWLARGLPRVEAGIGVNTGTMSVGNMGSAQRFDYTVMGDAVNLSSRLEGITKVYGVQTIVSEFTREAAGDTIWTREVDSVRVKGKKEPVRIFELVGKTVIPELAARVEMFEDGLVKYRAGDFAGGQRRFEEVLRIAADDGPAQVFVKRCKLLIAQPPQGEWDGVFTLTEK